MNYLCNNSDHLKFMCHYFYKLVIIITYLIYSWFMSNKTTTNLFYFLNWKPAFMPE